MNTQPAWVVITLFDPVSYRGIFARGMDCSSSLFRDPYAAACFLGRAQVYCAFFAGLTLAVARVRHAHANTHTRTGHGCRRRH